MQGTGSTTTESTASGDLGPIRALLRRVIAAADPEQVWLFGSRARGDARDDSDWDILAVVADDAPDELFDPEVTWRLFELGRDRADVVVMTRSEFLEDADTPNTLPFPVTREGRLVYER